MTMKVALTRSETSNGRSRPRGYGLWPCLASGAMSSSLLGRASVYTKSNDTLH